MVFGKLRERRQRRQKKALQQQLPDRTVHVFVESRQEYRCADCQAPTEDPGQYHLRLQQTTVNAGQRDDMYALVCPDCFAKSLMAMGFTPAEVVRMPDPRVRRRRE